MEILRNNPGKENLPNAHQSFNTGCLNIHGYMGCLNIHGYIGCLNIHGTHVTVNNYTNNNVVFFFVSDLKIVY